MPAETSPTNVPRCCHCDAVLMPGARQCWLCGAHVDVDGGASRSALEAPSAVRRSIVPTGGFSLATMMLFVTLVAIICGVFSIVPGIGVAMALVMLPALTHTAILVRGEAKSGHLLGAGEKIMLFVGSLMLVAMAGVAAAIAFGVTCFVSFWPASAVGDALGTGQYPGLAWGFTVGIGLGGIVAAYVAYRLLVMLSRSKGRDALSRRSKMILAAAIVLTIVGAMILAGMGL